MSRRDSDFDPNEPDWEPVQLTKSAPTKGAPPGWGAQPPTKIFGQFLVNQARQARLQRGWAPELAAQKLKMTSQEYLDFEDGKLPHDPKHERTIRRVYGLY